MPNCFCSLVSTVSCCRQTLTLTHTLSFYLTLIISICRKYSYNTFTKSFLPLRYSIGLPPTRRINHTINYSFSLCVCEGIGIILPLCDYALILWIQPPLFRKYSKHSFLVFRVIHSLTL